MDGHVYCPILSPLRLIESCSVMERLTRALEAAMLSAKVLPGALKL